MGFYEIIRDIWPTGFLTAEPTFSLNRIHLSSKSLSLRYLAGRCISYNLLDFHTAFQRDKKTPHDLNSNPHSDTYWLHDLQQGTYLCRVSVASLQTTDITSHLVHRLSGGFEELTGKGAQSIAWLMVRTQYAEGPITLQERAEAAQDTMWKAWRG